jgi:hypothetical protein
MASIRSSETSNLTKCTRRYIPKNCILHSHRRENHKSCNVHCFVHTRPPLHLILSHSDLVRNIRHYSLKTNKVRSAAILATGRGGLLGCEASRITHFLDNRPTVGYEFVSLMPFTPRKIPGTDFCLEAESTPGP